MSISLDDIDIKKYLEQEKVDLAELPPRDILLPLISILVHKKKLTIGNFNHDYISTKNALIAWYLWDRLVIYSDDPEKVEKDIAKRAFIALLSNGWRELFFNSNEVPERFKFSYLLPIVKNDLPLKYQSLVKLYEAYLKNEPANSKTASLVVESAVYFPNIEPIEPEFVNWVREKYKLTLHTTIISSTSDRETLSVDYILFDILGKDARELLESNGNLEFSTDHWPLLPWDIYFEKVCFDVWKFVRLLSIIKLMATNTHLRYEDFIEGIEKDQNFIACRSSFNICVERVIELSAEAFSYLKQHGVSISYEWYFSDTYDYGEEGKSLQTILNHWQIAATYIPFMTWEYNINLVPLVFSKMKDKERRKKILKIVTENAFQNSLRPDLLIAIVLSVPFLSEDEIALMKEFARNDLVIDFLLGKIDIERESTFHDYTPPIYSERDRKDLFINVVAGRIIGMITRGEVQRAINEISTIEQYKKVGGIGKKSIEQTINSIGLLIELVGIKPDAYTKHSIISAIEQKHSLAGDEDTDIVL